MSPSKVTLRLGELLMVETDSEILTGTLKFIDPQRKIIELENVYDQRTSYQYTSSQILAIPQIKKLKIIHNDEQTHSNSCDTPTSSSSRLSDIELGGETTSSFNTAQQSPLSTPPQKQHQNPEDFVVPLSSTELKLLHQQLGAIYCIVQTDQRYHKALADIRTQPVVSLLMEPVDYGRVQHASVMAIATFHAVYLFDLVALGSIFRELKLLLEAERPRKAVHYSHKLVDHLQHRHGVQLGGIFDTFVAYALTTGVKEPLTLIDTIAKTLDIPRMYFQHDESDKRPYDPFRRPLTDAMRQMIAKKAILQLKLYEHLLHKHMLTNFYQQCSDFAHTFSNNVDATVALEMQPKSHAGFQHIQRKGKWQEILNAEFKMTYPLAERKYHDTNTGELAN